MTSAAGEGLLFCFQDVLVHKLFLFLHQKGGWSLCRAVNICFFTLVLVDARLSPPDVGVSSWDGMRLRFLAAWVDVILSCSFLLLY